MSITNIKRDTVMDSTSLLETPELRLRPFMEYENGFWYPVNPYALSHNSTFVEKIRFVGGQVEITPNTGPILRHSIHQQRQLSVWKVELIA